MLHIQVFNCNPLEENCYVLWSENREKACWIVDCGAFGASEITILTNFLAEKGLTPVRHLLTHGHFDHIFGAQAIYEQYGIGPSLLDEEILTYENAPELMRMLVPTGWNLSIPPVQEILKGGQTLQLDDEGDVCFRVLHTPGHTPGSCCFYCEKEHILLSGDTMFRHSWGRTDFPGGSEMEMRRSLHELLELPESTCVLPGHGPSTTIGEERYLI